MDHRVQRILARRRAGGLNRNSSASKSSGSSPREKEKTKVLVPHMTRQSQWEPIVQLIFAIRETGFDIHPVYDYEEQNPV